MSPVELSHSAVLQRTTGRPYPLPRSRAQIDKKGTLRPNRTRCQAARRRTIIQSDGEEHLGSSLDQTNYREFPGPAGKKGPPIRVLPIGGLGEIGMNCMLVGIYDRYILVDAGLMFPDFSEVGMQKILPDTSFIAQWKDKIEAVVITHGHEDHIGAIPWVLPALDPSTPIHSPPFVHHLLKYRLKQYNLWNEQRFFTFGVNSPFKLGPFECEAIRVTHSIPDCCGLILRSSYGTILHTGDWKIDENPTDGRIFDRTAFEKLQKENITLMMSDSTNVLTPGRSLSEGTVRQALINKITGYEGKGRIVTTLFASNLHRVGSLKSAADATGRKVCFIGLSLNSYLSAAVKSGDAPFDPKELIDFSALDDIDPNKVMVVTTGSQAEPMAALQLASMNGSNKLKIGPDDVLLYSARIIPGNERRVMKMMNRICKLGAKIEMNRSDNLHASGHGYKEELSEVIRLVQPQHFLPIHGPITSDLTLPRFPAGESVFLNAHAELAKELGVERTQVIHDGEMLGVKSMRNRRTVSSGSMQLMGDVDLTRYYNDGNNGTGTYEEMAIQSRLRMATDGFLVVSVDIIRPPRIAELLQEKSQMTGLKARIKLTTRGIWTDKGKLVHDLFRVAQLTISKCPVTSSCVTIDRALTLALRRECRKFNQINPEVMVVVHEHDPRIAAALNASMIRLTERKTRLSSVKTNPGEDSEDESYWTKIGSRKEGVGSGGKRDVSLNADLLQTDIEESVDRVLKGGKGKNEDGGSFRGKQGGEGGKSSRRRGRPRKKPVDARNTDLVPVPEQLMEERKKQNPRDNPTPGADLEYG